MLRILYFLVPFIALEGFSAGTYCLYNSTSSPIDISVQQNGYNVRKLEADPAGGTTSGGMLEDQKRLTLHPHTGIMLETVRNYSRSGGVATVALDPSNFIELRNLFLQKKQVGPILLSQDYTSDTFLDGFQDSKEDLKKYASRVCSTVVLSSRDR